MYKKTINYREKILLRHRRHWNLFIFDKQNVWKCVSSSLKLHSGISEDHMYICSNQMQKKLPFIGRIALTQRLIHLPPRTDAHIFHILRSRMISMENIYIGFFFLSLPSFVDAQIPKSFIIRSMGVACYQRPPNFKKRTRIGRKMMD